MNKMKILKENKCLAEFNKHGYLRIVVINESVAKVSGQA
jgi:hypothetical protein